MNTSFRQRAVLVVFALGFLSLGLCDTPEKVRIIREVVGCVALLLHTFP
jgi:hypothetical protein